MESHGSVSNLQETSPNSLKISVKELIAFFKVSYTSLQNAGMLPPKAWNITRTRWFVLKANVIIYLEISFLTEIPLSEDWSFWHTFGNAMLCDHLPTLPVAAPHHQAELFQIFIPSIIPPGSELRPSSEQCQVRDSVFPRWWRLAPKNCLGQCGSLVNSQYGKA